MARKTKKKVVSRTKRHKHHLKLPDYFWHIMAVAFAVTVLFYLFER